MPVYLPLSCTADVIKTGGICYTRVGPSETAPNIVSWSEYSTCEACESSSSSSSSSISSSVPASRCVGYKTWQSFFGGAWMDGGVGGYTCSDGEFTLGWSCNCEDPVCIAAYYVEGPPCDSVPDCLSWFEALTWDSPPFNPDEPPCV
jgi:hypothetical protein